MVDGFWIVSKCGIYGLFDVVVGIGREIVLGKDIMVVGKSFFCIEWKMFVL